MLVYVTLLDLIFFKILICYFFQKSLKNSIFFSEITCIMKNLLCLVEIIIIHTTTDSLLLRSNIIKTIIAIAYIILYNIK